MIYQYRDEKTGECFELEYPMSEGGPWEVVIGGRKLVRDDFGQVQPGRKERLKVGRGVGGKRIGNTALPKNWPYAKKFDPEGRPVFDTKSERTEAHARAAADGELLTARELSQPGTSRGMMVDD